MFLVSKWYYLINGVGTIADPLKKIKWILNSQHSLLIPDGSRN
jgi:hypothetical protein